MIRRYYARVTSIPDRAPDPRPQRTRAAIFAVAQEMGAEDTDVTVNALAQRAGVSRAAFYSHFSSLDDVMCGIIEQMVEQVMEEEPEVPAGFTPHELVCSEIYAMCDYVAEHRAVLRGMLTWKISHRAYGSMVDMFSKLFKYGYRLLDCCIPENLPRNETARFHGGGVAEMLVAWLRKSEREAAEGCTLSSDVLAESVIRVLPSWYTGIEIGAPVPPRPQGAPLIPVSERGSHGAENGRKDTTA